MHTSTISIPLSGGQSLECPLISLNTVIVGAGAAGLKCALRLQELGMKDVAVVVDKLGNGTSNNSGSDKQTYYKLGVFGAEPDSPMDFAKSLFQGGMMHGDTAYVEALGSAPAFFDLCRIGVPFPHNSFGAYVGYKTDHDPRQRATSAGPKTSHYMFECLLKEVQRHGTAIFDRHTAVSLLTDKTPDGSKRVIGLICLNKEDFWKPNYGLTVFNATNVVFATGGPGELYKISVWPHGQTGSHGIAFKAGAAGNNLTELQFGLASTKFRWNLSGTYQQVIPDYFSTDADGVSNKRHFLHDYFDDMPSMATNIFLKGYQWPFHAARLQNGGSSIIDIAVHREIAAGRRVFIDFMRNPTPAEGMEPFSIDILKDEAKQYLLKSGATQATPYERLMHMNPQSVELYAEHGIDLHQPLETAVCAQHCNGGLSVDLWWESNLRHLFPIGEVCGTHGVRPGGSALNATQVGAVRAAQRIANVYFQPPLPQEDFAQKAARQIVDTHEFHRNCIAPKTNALNAKDVRPQIQQRMTDSHAFIRSYETASRALREAKQLMRDIEILGIRASSPQELPRIDEDRALALTSVAFLQALVTYIEQGGGSRGAYMILDENGSLAVTSKQGTDMRHRPENLEKRNEILQVQIKDGTISDFTVTPTPVRPLPQDDSWFETTWADWNANRIFQ